MRFFFTLVALASLALALEDGKLYKTFAYDNGTLVTYDGITGELVETLTEGPLVDTYREAFAAKAAGKQRRQLSKRFVSCWGTPLDPVHVDVMVYDWNIVLRNTPGGMAVCSPSAQTAWWRFTTDSVMVYYCINTRNYCGNLDYNDFHYALFQMDAHCPRYTSSYFQWDGSPEIVGKARASTAVCLG